MDPNSRRSNQFPWKLAHPAGLMPDLSTLTDADREAIDPRSWSQEVDLFSRKIWHRQLIKTVLHQQDFVFWHSADQSDECSVCTNLYPHPDYFPIHSESYLRQAQSILGVPADGIYGPRTDYAMKAMGPGLTEAEISAFRDQWRDTYSSNREPLVLPSPLRPSKSLQQLYDEYRDAYVNGDDSALVNMLAYVSDRVPAEPRDEISPATELETPFYRNPWWWLLAGAVAFLVVSFVL